MHAYKLSIVDVDNLQDLCADPKCSCLNDLRCAGATHARCVIGHDRYNLHAHKRIILTLSIELLHSSSLPWTEEAEMCAGRGDQQSQD